MNRNLVAKHMNTYNRSSVVPDKRDKYLDDLAERERQYSTVSDVPENEWPDEGVYKLDEEIHFWVEEKELK